MLNTLSGLAVIIIFYFGAYQLIRDRTKANPFFIPILINLLIMTLLYLAGLMRVLRPAVWAIAAVGVLYFIFSLIKNRAQLQTEAADAVSAWAGSIRAFFTKKTSMRAMLALLVSACSAFAFMNIAINVWAHSRMTMALIFAAITSLMYPFIYAQAGPVIELIRKNRAYRYLSLGFFVIGAILFALFLRGNEYLVPRTDTILVQPAGDKNAISDQTEIRLIEVKEINSQAKLENQPQFESDGEAASDGADGISLKNSNESVLLNHSGRGPADYEFLFVETPTSGEVQITINEDVHPFNLYSDSENQRRIHLGSNYQPADILVLCTHFIFAILILQAILRYVYLFKSSQEGTTFSKKNTYFVYGFLAVVLFLFTRGMHFYVWDEFTHWGLFLKELSIKNNLPLVNFCTDVPRYIPGMTLFEYFFITFLGYAEGHAYFSYLAFIVPAVWVVMMDTPEKKILLRMMYLSTTIIALFFFPLYFVSMYVDAALGLLFGVGLIYYYKERDTGFGGAGMLLIMCGLQLLKTWGLIFSAILFGIIFLDKVFFQKQDSVEGRKQVRKEVLVLILLLLGSILLIRVPWLIHMERHAITSPLEGGAVVVDILQDGTELDVKSMFLYLVEITLKGRPGTHLQGAFSIIYVSILLFLIGILTSLKSKRSRLINGSILLFFIVNILLIFLTYFVNFSEDEAVRLASYERYASEYLMGWFMLIIYQITTCSRDERCPRNVSYISHIGLAAMIILFLPNMQRIVQIPPNTYIGRREILRYILEKNKETLFDGTYHRVFHIAQNTNGLTHHALHYELCPNTAQRSEWSFGDAYPSAESECDTILYNMDELKTIITSGYDFVLITDPDAQLWQYYGDLFQGHRTDGDQLFRVDGGQILLVE